MRLDDLAPAPGSRQDRKRVGRGIGSGHGRTSGRGTKGQRARNTVKPGFEGGQTPLHRRVPVKRGFTSPFKEEFAVVNIGQIAKLNGVTEITPELLVERGLVKSLSSRIKILGDGELDHPITVQAHKFSKSAVEKIEKAGGNTQLI
jgi:large subunit ribosomal protein L15